MARRREAIRRAVRPRPASGRHAGLNPEQIALQTREIVGRELNRLGAELPPTCLPRVGKMIELLAAWSAITNLTAQPGDPAELAFHVLDSLMPVVAAHREGPAALANAFGTGKQVLDLGSGAGFPGLVIAAAVPARVTLTEAQRRRASFLATTAEEMGLFEVVVVPERVTEKSLHESYDIVTCRALDSGSDFHRLARAALGRGGLALLYASAQQAAVAADSPVHGFELIANIPYELSRGSDKVPRAALVWRRR